MEVHAGLEIATIEFDKRSNSLERCLFIIDLDESCINNYDRFYVGDEFCDMQFMIKMSSIKKTVVSLYKRKKLFSIVLPILHENMFSKIIDFLYSINGYMVDGEVVCNDIGAAISIRPFVPSVVSGRFLTRSYISHFSNPHEDHILSHIKRSEIDFVNKQKASSLKTIKTSYYDNIAVYGLSNNRCVYKKLTDKFPEKNLCDYECERKSLNLYNKYNNKDFSFYKNAIVQNVDSQIPVGIDRIITYGGDWLYENKR